MASKEAKLCSESERERESISEGEEGGEVLFRSLLVGAEDETMMGQCGASCRSSYPQLHFVCSLSPLKNITSYCQKAAVAELVLSKQRHSLLCERSCVSLYELMGKSFWSGINTRKELLTHVSIIEQVMLLCFNLAMHQCL